MGVKHLSWQYAVFHFAGNAAEDEGGQVRRGIGGQRAHPWLLHGVDEGQSAAVWVTGQPEIQDISHAVCTSTLVTVQRWMYSIVRKVIMHSCGKLQGDEIKNKHVVLSYFTSRLHDLSVLIAGVPCQEHSYGWCAMLRVFLWPVYHVESILTAGVPSESILMAGVSCREHSYGWRAMLRALLWLVWSCFLVSLMMS